MARSSRKVTRKHRYEAYLRHTLDARLEPIGDGEALGIAPAIVEHWLHERGPLGIEWPPELVETRKGWLLVAQRPVDPPFRCGFGESEPVPVPPPTYETVPYDPHQEFAGLVETRAKAEQLLEAALRKCARA